MTDAARGDTTRLLEGNGAGFVRERHMAAAVQQALERLYHLDRTADVDAFLEPAGDGEREMLLVRECDDGAIEIGLRIPPLGDGTLDRTCQLIEGVSHFVYLTERARVGLEATQLELELQAEVDKYVVLAGSIAGFDARRSEQLRARLYDDVTYAQGSHERYRVANDVARRYVRRLEQRFVARRRFREMRSELRRFYRLGQEEKLRTGRAA